MNYRSQIIQAARTKDPDIGDDAMIVSMEWGYWIGGVYISKEEVDKIHN